MGGLNYQIEHHLFPSMPRDNLRLAQPVVRAYCLEKEIPYTEASLVGSYAIVIRYLNEVGLGRARPVLVPLRGRLPLTGRTSADPRRVRVFASDPASDTHGSTRRTGWRSVRTASTG